MTLFRHASLASSSVVCLMTNSTMELRWISTRPVFLTLRQAQDEENRQPNTLMLSSSSRACRGTKHEGALDLPSPTLGQGNRMFVLMMLVLMMLVLIVCCLKGGIGF